MKRRLPPSSEKEGQKSGPKPSNGEGVLRESAARGIRSIAKVALNEDTLFEQVGLPELLVIIEGNPQMAEKAMSLLLKTGQWSAVHWMQRGAKARILQAALENSEKSGSMFLNNLNDYSLMMTEDEMFTALSAIITRSPYWRKEFLEKSQVYNQLSCYEKVKRLALRLDRLADKDVNQPIVPGEQ